MDCFLLRKLAVAMTTSSVIARNTQYDEAIQITKIKYLYDKTYQNIGKGGIVYRLGLFLIIFWIASSQTPRNDGKVCCLMDYQICRNDKN
jgi:hypothetical protein